MPGIMIKAVKEMLSPTTKMDPDTSDVSTDDTDNNECLQRDGTEEACRPPVDQQSKVTPSKNMDSETCDVSTDDTDNNDCPQRDGTEEACRPPVDQQKVSMAFNHIQGSNKSDVKKSTTAGVYIKEQNIREQHVHNVGPSDDIKLSTEQGVKRKIRISVPAENGETIVRVICTNNEIVQLCYEPPVAKDGQEWPLRSIWIFKNNLHGLIETIMADPAAFPVLISKLKEMYRCILEKMHNKSCLVLEFLHDTEENRDRMMQEQETVKTMFMEFLHSIGKDAPSCSLQVCSEPATTNISDTNEIDYDKENAASQSLTKDERKLPPRSSDEEKSELKETKFPQRPSDEKSQHYKSEPTESTSFTKSTSYDTVEYTSFDTPPFYDHSSDSDSSDSESALMGLQRKRLQRKRLQRKQSESLRLQRRESALMESESLRIQIKPLVLHPLPASTVNLYDCMACYRVCRDANYHMGTEYNVFFIHLHKTQVDRKTQAMKPSAEYQFKKALSSMRNSGGGVLYVHVCESRFRKDKNAFQSTVVPVLGAMLTEEEIMSNGFRYRREVSEGEQVYKIDVLPSETFISVDLKTKLLGWCMGKHESASVEKLRQLLLSKRTISTTEPTVEGLTHMNHVDAVKIYVDRIDDKHVYQSWDAPYRSVSAWVNHIINDCSLPEYVTSISKRKQGGSVYVGRTSTDSKVDMDGIPFPRHVGKHDLQSMLAEKLQTEISVFKNRHSDIVLKTKDVFQIEIHDTGTYRGIIEVAVRSVDGCVFHDPLGPASFKIEKDSNAFVRLSFDKWLEAATG